MRGKLEIINSTSYKGNWSRSKKRKAKTNKSLIKPKQEKPRMNPRQPAILTEKQKKEVMDLPYETIDVKNRLH